MPKVAIIGAGSSGITVAKALKEAGVAFDVFEKGSQIGGMWRYENDNGQSSCYANLHIDSSRANLGYSDYPIPASWPDYLSHRQFLEYLIAYAEHFGIGPQIAFRTSVEAVEPFNDGWSLRLSTGQSRAYDAVIVANGHLSEPRLAEFPGEFSGTIVHSHHYRDPAPYDGKNVVVVGIGNSAVDIAVDISRRARSVVLSTRRSAWIMPKYIMGVPTDRWSRALTRNLKLPTPVVRRIMGVLGRLAIGDQRRFGIPHPAHPIWKEHATISQDLLPAIGHGRIVGEIVAAFARGAAMGFENGVEAECLRRLCDPQPRTIRRRSNRTRSIDHLDGVGHGHNRNRGTRDQRRINRTRDHLVRDESARGIVNQHNVRRLTCESLQPGADRRLPRSPAIDRRLIGEVTDRLIENIRIVRVADRLDHKHVRMRAKRLHCPRKDGFAAD